MCWRGWNLCLRMDALGWTWVYKEAGPWQCPSSAKVEQNGSAGHLQILVNGLANLCPYCFLPSCFVFICLPSMLLPLGKVLLLDEVDFMPKCLQAQTEVVDCLVVARHPRIGPQESSKSGYGISPKLNSVTEYSDPPVIS